jgi:uncharacterized OB-fold protein
MGKCGGRELNYVSDVDVVFVAEPAERTAAATRLAAEVMRVGREAFFEVDAALRPEGKQGPLVRTLDSHTTYYRRWARTWEFQALLKARPLCGDLELAQQYCDAMQPMVWTASQRPDFVADVQHMRRRVENSVPAALRDRELKLGRGGLRDVEFAVQLLQLVHGRADTSLQTPGTIDALAALSGHGYVGRADAAELTSAYEFLRLLEHRLQLQKLRRTHTLPAADDEEAMRLLARSARIHPDGTRDAAGVLAAEIRRTGQRVRQQGQPALQLRPGHPPVHRLQLRPDGVQADAAGGAGPDARLRLRSCGHGALRDHRGDPGHAQAARDLHPRRTARRGPDRDIGDDAAGVRRAAAGRPSHRAPRRSGSVRRRMRPLPQLTFDSEFFWTSGSDGVLRVQQCQSCQNMIHPPQPVCRYCRATEMGVREVSGFATLIGFTVNRRFSLPGLPAPYVVAQVALEEDPRIRLTTNAVECDPDKLELGMRMEARFEQHGDVWLPLFRPTAEQPVLQLAARSGAIAHRYCRPMRSRRSGSASTSGRGCRRASSRTMSRSPESACPTSAVG